MGSAKTYHIGNLQDSEDVHAALDKIFGKGNWSDASECPHTGKKSKTLTVAGDTKWSKEDIESALEDAGEESPDVRLVE